MATKIKIEQEVTLGELLAQIIGRHGCHVMGTDHYDKPVHLSGAGLESIAEEFAEALRMAQARENNRR